MAKNPKYVFDSKSLSFEKAKRRPWVNVWRIVGFVSIACVAGLFMANYITQYLATPKEVQLRNDKRILISQLVEMERQVDEMEEKIGELNNMDVKIYRSIYEANPPKKPDYRGADFKELQSLPRSKQIIRIRQKLQKLDALAIAQAPRLKLIAVMATGTNQVDLETATEREIVVSNAIGYGTGSVVQHCWSLILALTTKLESYHQAAVGGRWQQSRFFCSMDFPVRELSGKILGIVGAGELGLGVAKIAEAFGMQVIYAGLPGRIHNSAIERVAFDAFLARADIISIHCPLTADTRDLIGEAEFALMQSSTLVINSARGGIVNEAALKQALCNGDIAGAATDVLTVEPPVDGNLLLDPSIPNLIITPHSAWVAQEARINF